MPTILSLTQLHDDLWGAGPEGLFLIDRDGNATATPQPEQELYCCGGADDRLLVGGLPHGTAYTFAEAARRGEGWQASWMDGVAAPVLCFAADPRIAETGVVLAGTAGGGVLRSANRGQGWASVNFGLLDFTVLALAWAPVAPAGAWPQWEIVFAATEEGVYRSPSGGRGWKRAEGLTGIVQTLAVARDFHAQERESHPNAALNQGVVLAGTESNGLWRAEDGGRCFSRVEEAPQQVDALVALDDGWLLSDGAQLWQSTDGLAWSPLPEQASALAFLATLEGVYAGGAAGVSRVERG